MGVGAAYLLMYGLCGIFILFLVGIAFALYCWDRFDKKQRKKKQRATLDKEAQQS